MMYGPTKTTCSRETLDLCGAFGATCEPTFSTSGKRNDLCRWSAANTAAKCNATQRGLWTTAGSGFDLEWPTAIPNGQAGACITEVSNVMCSDDDHRFLCERHGARCDRAEATDGHETDLCRFIDNASTLAQCDGAGAGLWTIAGDRFSDGWPTAVPPGKGGACITQVPNLECSDDARSTCELAGALCERAFATDGHRHDLCRWAGLTT